MNYEHAQAFFWSVTYYSSAAVIWMLAIFLVIAIAYATRTLAILWMRHEKEQRVEDAKLESNRLYLATLDGKKTVSDNAGSEYSDSAGDFQENNR